MGKIPVTANGDAVYSDGNGNFSLERTDSFNVAAEFYKLLPWDDEEAYRTRASEQLGIELQYETY